MKIKNTGRYTAVVCNSSGELIMPFSGLDYRAVMKAAQDFVADNPIDKTTGEPLYLVIKTPLYMIKEVISDAQDSDLGD